MQGTQRKKWEDLEIKDDFLFGKVMRNPKLCIQMLERILNIEIDHIDFPDIQKTLDFDFDAKSIRLDVYAKDEKGTVFNVEMQALNKDDLRKRSRYYQAMIDLDLMEKAPIMKALHRVLSSLSAILICLEKIDTSTHLKTDAWKIMSFR